MLKPRPPGDGITHPSIAPPSITVEHLGITLEDLGITLEDLGITLARGSLYSIAVTLSVGRTQKVSDVGWRVSASEEL